MLSGDFERKLKKLNNRIRVFCGNEDIRAAGIYVVTKEGDYLEICATDKNWVPEYPIFRADGGYIKTGWRRTLNVLISRKLFTKEQAQKVFSYRIEGNRKPVRPVVQQRSLAKKLDDLGVKVLDEGGY